MLRCLSFFVKPHENLMKAPHWQFSQGELKQSPVGDPADPVLHQSSQETRQRLHMYSHFYFQATALAYYNCWLS